MESPNSSQIYVTCCCDSLNYAPFLVSHFNYSFAPFTTHKFILLGHVTSSRTDFLSCFQQFTCI
ncbi:hypothetical protein DR999_PMT22687 [Platysternon megacephalum]|uniref:Uncharacterized protein n=1 Tax=Platysternon megacephalum TaxID=55544 RepID=A0A4D9DHL0_9SAUR|nr:hypothetical protein DR999_PMT22687 [Platysternon megacephalum]